MPVFLLPVAYLPVYLCRRRAGGTLKGNAGKRGFLNYTRLEIKVQEVGRQAGKLVRLVRPNGVMPKSREQRHSWTETATGSWRAPGRLDYGLWTAVRRIGR
jgi:hypothetical protein